MTLPMICRGIGIFSTGNIKPLSIIVGSMVPTKAINIAVCWLSVTIDITIPSKRLVMMKMMLIANSKSRLPLMGKSRTLTLRIRIEIKIIIDKIKYGIALAKIIMYGFIGDTSRTSMVPISFSRTIAMAVIKTQMIKRIKAITPGTKLGAPLSCGL